MAISEKTDISSTGKNVEKGKPYAWLMEMYIGSVTKENRISFPKTLKIEELLHHPAVPLLGIYPKNMKTLIWTDVCIFTFI